MIEIGQLVWWVDGGGIVRGYYVEGETTYVMVDQCNGLPCVKVPVSKVFPYGQ